MPRSRSTSPTPEKKIKPDPEAPPPPPPNTMADTNDKDSGKGGAAPPTPFNGDRSKVDAFLMECALYFKAYPKKYADNVQKTNTALSYLKEGDALTWKEQYLRSKLKAGSDDYDFEIPEWKTFVTEFKFAFTQQDAIEDALFKLDNIHQGSKRVDEHNVAFNLLLGKAKLSTNPTEESEKRLLIDKYKRTIHPSVLEKVLMMEKVPTDLPTFMDKAATFDCHWSQARRIINPQHCNQGGGFRVRFPSQGTQSNPIVIDALSTQDTERYCREGLCFHCSQKGHISRFCPTKGQNTRYNQRNNYSNTGPSRQTNNSYTQNQKRSTKDAALQIRNIVANYTDKEREEIEEECAKEGF